MPRNLSHKPGSKAALPSRSEGRLWAILLIVTFLACLGRGFSAERSIPKKEDGSAAESSRTAGETALKSGLDVGEEVPSFYIRVVTGPLRNRSVCYVCRNGQRPVVMVLLKSLDAKLKPLLKQVDELVDQHRAEGLKSFGTYLSEDPGDAVSAVQTFSFDHKIVMPLAVASNRIGESDLPNLDAENDVALVLYENRRVVKRFVFGADQIDEEKVEAVSQAVKQLVKSPVAGSER